jgi:hypothetical protein
MSVDRIKVFEDDDATDHEWVERNLGGGVPSSG